MSLLAWSATPLRWCFCSFLNELIFDKGKTSDSFGLYQEQRLAREYPLLPFPHLVILPSLSFIYFISIWVNLTNRHHMYLMCQIWCFDVCMYIYSRMIITVKLINMSITSHRSMLFNSFWVCVRWKNFSSLLKILSIKFNSIELPACPKWLNLASCCDLQVIQS